jgi:hypothetical protein
VNGSTGVRFPGIHDHRDPPVAQREEIEMRFKTGDTGNEVTVVSGAHMPMDLDFEHNWEFGVETSSPDGFVTGLTRAQMHDLHKALSEMLGLGVPTAKAPLTASKPAKNLRRMNGGL